MRSTPLSLTKGKHRVISTESNDFIMAGTMPSVPQDVKEGVAKVMGRNDENDSVMAADAHVGLVAHVKPDARDSARQMSDGGKDVTVTSPMDDMSNGTGITNK